MTDLCKEKPCVKTYCGGKPNYCTPEVTPDVDAVNISQERVDEKAKGEHEPVAWLIQYKTRHDIMWGSTPGLRSNDQILGMEPLYTAPPKREWVGLTDEEYDELMLSGDWGGSLIQATQAKLKEKNT